MSHHPELEVDLSMDDRYINLIEQGVDLAIRMRNLPDSSLGSRFIGMNPFLCDHFSGKVRQLSQKPIII
jgi:DNA-binding transcriptional LysR family regulator